MTRKRRATTPPKPARDPRGCVLPFLSTTAIIAVIVYIALLLAARTDGFIYTVEQRLTQHAGIPVHVDRAWLKPNLDIVLEGVSFGETDTLGGPAFLFETVYLTWQIRRALHPRQRALTQVRVQGGQVHLQRDAQGVWQPVILAGDAHRIAQRLGLTMTTAAAAMRAMDHETAIQVEGVDLLWLNAHDDLEMALYNVQVGNASAQLLDRTVRYQELRVEQTFSAGATGGEHSRTLLWIDGVTVSVTAAD